jgi:uncharacterized protein (DUF305 family)
MTYAEFEHAMHAGMQKMMSEMHATPPSGSADVDFLQMMIPHHAGAVEMARLVLAAGTDPLVRQLAEDVIAGQSTEIVAMRARLARIRGGGDAEPDGFPALGATRGD